MISLITNFTIISIVKQELGSSTSATTRRPVTTRRPRTTQRRTTRRPTTTRPRRTTQPRRTTRSRRTTRPSRTTRSPRGACIPGCTPSLYGKYLPNRCDASKFHICTSAKVYTMSCARGLVFKSKCKCCDYK